MVVNLGRKFRSSLCSVYSTRPTPSTQQHQTSPCSVHLPNFFDFAFRPNSLRLFPCMITSPCVFPSHSLSPFNSSHFLSFPFQLRLRSKQVARLEDEYKREKKNKGRLYMLHMYSEYIERAVKEKKSCQNMVRGYPTQKPKNPQR